MKRIEWKSTKLGEVITFQRGFDLPTSQRLPGGVPVISSGGQTGWHMEAKVPSPGVVTGRYGSVGEVYYIRKPFWPLNTTLFVSDFHGNFPLYIFYLLQSLDFFRFSDKTGVPGVNRNDLHRIRVGHPPLPEQKKIAEILSAWDEAIELTRKLIDAKKQSRKALKQKLLTGKKRLKEDNEDEWPIRTIGELVKPVSRPISKPKDPYLSIGIRSHGKGTFHKVVERPEKVMMDILYCIEPRDLIVNITFAWEGAIAIATEEDGGGLVSHRFPAYHFKEKEADIDFFRNLMLTKRFIWNLGLISPGGAGRNRVLKQKDFLKLKVFIPGIKTQSEIGKILSTSDKEIKLLENYLVSDRKPRYLY